MNIKNLVSHVIDRAVDRITTGVDDELLDRLSRKLNLAALGEHIEVEYSDLAQELDYADLAHEIDKSEIADRVEVDPEEVAYALSTSEVARHLDTEEVARHLDCSAVAGYLDCSDVAAEIGDISENVAAYLDYSKLAEHLNPMKTLASTRDGEQDLEGVVGRLNLDSIAEKLLDAAVDKLLFLANKSVEEGLAHEQKTETEESNGVSANTNLGV